MRGAAEGDDDPTCAHHAVTNIFEEGRKAIDAVLRGTARPHEHQRRAGSGRRREGQGDADERDGVYWFSSPACAVHNGLYSLGGVTVGKREVAKLKHLTATCVSPRLRRLHTLLPSSRVCSFGASALVTISSSASATSGKPLQHAQAQQEPTQNLDESTRETTCSRPGGQLTCAR